MNPRPATTVPTPPGRNTPVRPLDSERGGALITVLAVIITVTTIAAVVLALSGREWLISSGHRGALEAFYIAEAGGQVARIALRQFVELGLDAGLHARSAHLDRLHDRLRALVAGSGRLEGTCARAETSAGPSGRPGAGSNSLGILELAQGADRFTGGLDLSTPDATPVHEVVFRVVPGSGVLGLQTDGPDAPFSLGNGRVVARVSLSRDGSAWAEQALPGCPEQPRYVFPFRYTIDAEGQVGAARRRISASGAFRIVVEQPGFARYLLFTNTFGSRPVCSERRPCRGWLPEQTYDGPVHTNDRLWIAGAPVFLDRVTSANILDADGDGELDPAKGDRPGPPLARFYNGGAGCPDRDADSEPWCDLDAAANPPADTPWFLRGFVRSWRYLALPSGAEAQEWAALTGARPTSPQGQTSPASLTNVDRRAALGLPISPADVTPPQVAPTVFLPTGTAMSDVETCALRGGNGFGGRLRGGVYVTGPVQHLRLSVDGRTSVLEISTDPEHRWVIRVNQQAGRTDVLLERGTGRTPLTCQYAGVPNGVVFVRGDVDELSGPPRRRADDGHSAPPAIQRDSALTVVATGGIHIASDLRYEVDPRGPDGVWSPQPCTGDDRCDVGNMLGLYSVEGDIRVSQTAPANLVVHAVLMAGRGAVEIATAGRTPRPGTVTLLGGIISRYGGAMDGIGQAARIPGGSALALHYDHRTGVGMADPPAFPRLPLLGVRGTPGLEAKPAWVERP
jgi:hypothetical protein